MSYEWVLKLNESNSRLHKEQVVDQAFAQAQLGDAAAMKFLDCVYSAYSPFVTFGIKQVPESDSQVADSDTDWAAFEQLTSRLWSRELSGHAARDAVIETMGKMSANAWNHLARLVLIKDLRAGVTETTFNKTLKGSDYEIPVFKCQLATDINKVPGALNGKKQLEVKLDGVRVLAVVSKTGAVLYSRNGIEFENFERVAKDLHEVLWHRVVAAFPQYENTSVVFDGEVISHSFNALMKSARRKKQTTSNDAVYHVFDMLPYDNFFRDRYYNMPQAERSKNLSRVLPASFAGARHIKLVPHINVDLDTAQGRETLDRFMADAVAGGFEGIMIKSADAPYECSRGTFWLKQKPWIEISLPVVGIEEGTGRNKGKLGALVCSGIDDDIAEGVTITSNVGSGFSDKQRSEFYQYRSQIIECIAEIRADSVSQNQDGTHSLRFPRFKTLRGFVPGEKI